MEKLRKRLPKGGELQPLFDTILAAFDTYETAASAKSVHSSTLTGNARVQHAKPSQRQLDVVSEVLNLAELLEQILLHLPVADLLRAQRVCKHFRTTIRTTDSLLARVLPADDVQHRIQLRTIRHVGQGRMMSPEPGFHNLAFLRPHEWHDLEQSALLDDIYVAEPPATGFMIRQTCYRHYLPTATDPFVVSVASGVKFKHVFAALRGWLWQSWPPKRKCANVDTCKDREHAGREDSHPVQIHICWEVDWEGLKAKPRYEVFDLGDGVDLELCRR
ncbi:hypothetical protein LTR36_000859 [Oleoguttula mirabilis]|uniref:F-box domain-containing protein n=1 Tax=Oleoguttula mirabilis TaxID=1507867 RepID=A0AAV9J4S5_9PEZI|nr:hypothetical protein LTR36_000859 [Oleoguttula mirabilis]